MRDVLYKSIRSCDCFAAIKVLIQYVLPENCSELEIFSSARIVLRTINFYNK